jgi:hypothetical protein
MRMILDAATVLEATAIEPLSFRRLDRYRLQ